MLQPLADALRSVDVSTADVGTIQEADRAMDELVTGVRQVRDQSEDNLFAAATLTMTLRSAIEALTPQEASDREPAASAETRP